MPPASTPPRARPYRCQARQGRDAWNRWIRPLAEATGSVSTEQEATAKAPHPVMSVFVQSEPPHVEPGLVVGEGLGRPVEGVVLEVVGHRDVRVVRERQA